MVGIVWHIFRQLQFGWDTKRLQKNRVIPFGIRSHIPRMIDVLVSICEVSIIGVHTGADGEKRNATKNEMTNDCSRKCRKSVRVQYHVSGSSVSECWGDYVQVD